MKHPKLSTSALLTALNSGNKLTAQSGSNAMEPVLLTSTNQRYVRGEKILSLDRNVNYYHPSSLKQAIQSRGQGDVDVGILIVEGDPGRENTFRHLQFLETCPATCTNEALCDCMTDYDNAGGNCPSIITAACKNTNEIKNCTPDAERLARATYLYCPMFECFESKGLKMDDEIEAYLECQCVAYTNLCQECETLKGIVPYCEELISKHGELCANLVECCANETSVEGLMRCNDMLITVEVYEQKPGINTTDIEATEVLPLAVNSVSKEETSDLDASSGRAYAGRKQMTATTILIVGSIGYLTYNFL
ncbi:hypothetical protein HJC23_012951 [Cyclotella cryptica]|uniref:Uncharacterized protein n=1 Tax=Cyclotella cryptica TaxID=29204 RepID=A0ABD3Q3I0_9STRA|eukprot:CCRYP_009309-RA/>CCRYP_009309-RA protein AED:0.23 eAED:0.23 QI:0/-1/0/1/-1/1/1/0/306